MDSLDLSPAQRDSVRMLEALFAGEAALIPRWLVAQDTSSMLLAEPVAEAQATDAKPNTKSSKSLALLWRNNRGNPLRFGAFRI